MKAISTQEIHHIIAEVPDVNDPREINYWVKRGDEEIYIEGWCDKCLAGTGFPPMAEGGTTAKIDYIESLTDDILQRKAKERGLELVEGGFVELEEAQNLYGVTYGVYRKPVKQPSRGGTMEPTNDQLERMAERASVGAAGLVGDRIAQEVSRRLVEAEAEKAHQSPISPHCEAVLRNLEGGNVACWDFRGTRAAVMCYAWQKMEQERLPTLPVSEGWRVVREKCSMR